MAELFDNSNNLITSRVLNVIPQPDVVTVKSRLLDGSYNLQQIGAAAKKVDVIALVSYTGKQALDSAQAVTAPVKVTADGRYHTGVIDGQPYYERLKPDLYRVTFTILQQSEGVA